MYQDGWAGSRNGGFVRIFGQARFAVVAAVAAGLLLVPAPASAKPADQENSSRACGAPESAAADKALADRLRPIMNGPRLGRSIAGTNISCARVIVQAVRDRGLNERAATIALTTAIAESSLHNYTLAVDHDSLGLFQQRPSQGWGRPHQLVDPRYAVDKFLNSMISKYPAGRWMTGDVGQICQRIQRSAIPGAYAREVHDAALITAALWSGVPAGSATPVPEATGPFQRTLPTAGTALSTADAQHTLTTTDWNSDSRADLVVIRRSGTATGRTELYILDGASTFQRLLLTTGTALRPTDDRHEFSLADVNGDGRPDLIVVQKSGTAGGRTEVRVLDGASFFQRYLTEVVTPLGPTDDRHRFTTADWNTDGRADLVVVQKSGTASGKTEVRVLDAATNYQTYLQEFVTARAPMRSRDEVTMTDWNGDGRPDLVVTAVSSADGRRLTVQILDGATGFTKTLLTAKNTRAATADRYGTLVVNWDDDDLPDLVSLQASATAAGRAEAHVLSGKR